ncbi:MAG: hypothetical protein ACPHRO_13045, partial [Nannocystaceae bacterium]
MNHRRLIEIVGSFLLGGGCVAFVYELGTSGGVEFASPRAGSPADVGDAGQASSPTGGDDAGITLPPGAEDPGVETDRPDYARRSEDGTYVAYPPIFDAQSSHRGVDLTAYPLHALVVTSGVFVRERADRESRRLGMMRQGARLRVAQDKIFGGGCTGGWRKVSTGGFMCGGAGISVGTSPPEDGLITSRAPDVDTPLPFEY